MNLDPAIWSAIAATFAALSSFLIMRIQRANLLESVRPELIITGWHRQCGGGETARDVITFSAVRNVGRGPALHVYMNCFHEEDSFPQAVMSTHRYPIVAQGDQREMNGEITVWWKNVKQRNGGQTLPITVIIYCWDTRDVRHETTYELFVTNPPMLCAATEELAPGVALTTRKTVQIPVWRLKLKRSYSRCKNALVRVYESLRRSGKPSDTERARTNDSIRTEHLAGKS